MEPIAADDLEFLLNMYGFQPMSEDSNSYQLSIKDLVTVILSVNDDGSVSINSEFSFDTAEDLIMYLDELLSRHEIEVFSCVALCNPSDTKTAVKAAITTRDLAKNLVRVRSSNVWAYTINIRNMHDKVGDVLCQFKGPQGGPGDIYLYYDVPVNLWRKWLAAPSKGHFFWQYIRNSFSYRKLTGDKRGKLKNAIN